MSNRRKCSFKVFYWHNEDQDNKTVIHVGGRTADNKTVYCLIDNFTPFVNVELPSRDGLIWDKSKVTRFFEMLQKEMKWFDQKTQAQVNYGPIGEFKFYKRFCLHYMKEIYTVFLNFPSSESVRKLTYKLNNTRGRGDVVVPGVGTFQPGEFKVHEANIDPILKLSADKGIKLASWIQVIEAQSEEVLNTTIDARKFTTADIDMRVEWTDIKPIDPPKDVYIFPSYCSFDLECNSTNHNSKLPNPDLPENVVTQVSMVFGTLNNPNRKHTLISLGDPRQEQIEKCDELIVFDSEKKLLLGFSKLIQERDPDIFIHYNGLKFDWDYLIKRAEFNGLFDEEKSKTGKRQPSDFALLSRIEGKYADIKVMRWSSQACGEQTGRYLECHGRTNVDVLIEVERNHRLPNYRLNTVAEKFLGQQKEDVSPRELFMLWDLTHDVLPLVKNRALNMRELVHFRAEVEKIFEIRKCTGSIVKKYRKKLLSLDGEKFGEACREAMEIMGIYCIQDTILPIDLVEKLNIWTSMEAMSNVTHVPMTYLHTRGQQIKVLSQVYREAIPRKIVIPTLPRKDVIEKYQGATVIEANAGDYGNVATLDFASLYPTIMIAFNISYDTILNSDDKTPDELCHVLEFKSHVGCEHDEQKRKKKAEDVICKDYRLRFRKVQYKIDTEGNVKRDFEGLMPRLERNLMAARKEKKKEMGKVEAILKMHKGKATEEELENYKKWGHCIVEKGSLNKEEESTAEINFNTLNANQLAIKIACNSVGGNTPIPCLVDGQFRYLPIESLFSNKYTVDEDGNELCDGPKNIQVWSDKGWADIKYVIRHEAPDVMHRVLTHTGCVDVSAEHSLLDENGEEIKTSELKPGDTLLHISAPLPDDTPEMPQFTKIDDEDVMKFEFGNDDEKLAFAHGLFFAEGTCGIYGSLHDVKSSWCIYNTDIQLLKKCKDILSGLCDNKFELYDPGVRKSKVPNGDIYDSQVYRLLAQGHVKKIASEYRDLFYNDRKEKKVPDYVLTSNYKVRLAFFVGYYAGDGNRNLEKGIVINNRGQLGTASLYYLARSLGYKVSISYPKDESPDIFRLQCSTKYRNNKITAIKSIKDAPIPPAISKTQKDVIRNGQVLVPDKDGNYMYKHTKIVCERVPKQGILDTIDKIQNTPPYRGRITEYITSEKKISYACDTCGSLFTCGMPRSFGTERGSVCKCASELRYIEVESKQSTKSTKEYIYDIETSTHHFAAGVGDMIVHNSAYGVMGVQNGMIPLIEGAASVTAMGRRLIMMTIDRIKKEYPFAKLVYGDSVSRDTPILCRLNGKIFYRTIDNLPSSPIIFDDGEKESYSPENGLEVWTDKGFTALKNIIRHKTTKKMFRILTHTGCVDVTEDHSLLNEAAEKITPNSVKVGDKLLHQNLPKVGGEESVSYAYAMGLFYGDGSCGGYRNPAGNKYSWAINNTNLDFLNKAKECLSAHYNPNITFKILDTMDSSHVYKLVAQGDNVKDFVMDWRELFYDHERYKKVPDEVFEYDLESRQAFFDGYYAADGDKDDNGYLRFDNKGKIGSAGLYLLANSLGYPVSINIRSDKPKIYRMTLTRDNKAQRINPNQIKKIIELPPTEDYVYDLETENHHFAAGVGRMVVHNTDSCMIHFTGKTLAESWDLADEASKIATHSMKCYVCYIPEDYCVTTHEGEKVPIKKFTPTNPNFKHLNYKDQCHVLDYHNCPIELEFENLYGRYLLLTKKRYFAYSVNKKGDLLGITKKGIVLTRRDNCKYLRDTYEATIKGIVDDLLEQDVMYRLYDRIQMLFTRQISAEHLIIYMGVKNIINYAESKKTKKGRTVVSQIYTDQYGVMIEDVVGPLDPRLVYRNLPQVLLALKMIRRGEEIPPNTRLEFLYLLTKGATHQGEKAEDYTYYKEHKEIENLKPDNLHYIEKQLTMPITELLTVKFKKDVIPYVEEEERFRRCIDALSEKHRPEVARKTVYIKSRPVKKYAPEDGELIGWDVLKAEGYTPDKHSIGKLAKDNPFTEYHFKKYLAISTFVVDEMKKPVGNSLGITKELYPDLYKLCTWYKSLELLKSINKKYGIKCRKWAKPTKFAQKLQQNVKIVMLTDEHAEQNVSTGALGTILIRYDLGTKADPIYHYDILIGENEATGTIIKNVPRKSFTTYTVRDSKVMKNILKYREHYAEVVEHLNKINAPIKFEGE